MSLTKEEAIALGKMVLVDIDYWGDDIQYPKARLIEGELLASDPSKSEPYWLVSFSYGQEDFGENVAHVFIVVDAETSKVEEKIIHRGGSIKIKFDATTGKYARVK